MRENWSFSGLITKRVPMLYKLLTFTKIVIDNQNSQFFQQLNKIVLVQIWWHAHSLYNAKDLNCYGDTSKMLAELEQGQLQSWRQKKDGLPQFPSEEEWEKLQETLHWAFHGVHTVNNVMLTELVQFHHHSRNDPPNMSPSTSENFSHVWGQEPAKE